MNTLTYTQRPRVLLVDDDDLVLLAMHDQLRRGCEVQVASSAREGLELLSEHTFDVVVSDQVMPEMTGDEFLAMVYQCWPNTSRILITGFSDLESVVRAVNHGKISQYLSKPWTADQLIRAVRLAFKEVQERVIQSEQYLRMCEEKVRALKALEEGRQFLKDALDVEATLPHGTQTRPRASGMRLIGLNGEPALIQLVEDESEA